MHIEERVTRLEKELSVLGAVIDGGQFQTRESTAYAISTVAKHLADVGVIDIKKLQAYLDPYLVDSSVKDDYMGETLRLLASQLIV